MGAETRCVIDGAPAFDVPFVFWLLPTTVSSTTIWYDPLRVAPAEADAFVAAWEKSLTWICTQTSAPVSEGLHDAEPASALEGGS